MDGRRRENVGRTDRRREEAAVRKSVYDQEKETEDLSSKLVK